MVLSGAATVPQLAANLAALDLPPIDLPDVAEDPTRYWHTRSQLHWT